MSGTQAQWVEGWRFLFGAVTALATMPGSLVERVGYAYWHHLRRVSPNPQLPPELREDFAEMLARLHVLYPTPDSRHADPEEAMRVAKQIVKLYERLGTQP